MAQSDNYRLPSKQRVEMLINEYSNLNLTYGVDYDFGAVKPYGVGLRYNTSLLLHFRNQRQGIIERIFYRRLSLNVLRDWIKPPTLHLAQPGFYLNDILHLLNAHYGTAFEIGELINDQFTQDNTSYEGRASETSLAWHGGTLPFNVLYDTVELKSVLPIHRLDGLYPPTRVPTTVSVKHR